MADEADKVDNVEAPAEEVKDAPAATEEKVAESTGDVEMKDAEAEGKEETKEEEAKEEEAAKEPEKPKEPEQDAEEDTRTRVAANTWKLNRGESTVNVLPVDDKLLMTYTDSGFQHLLAGTRTTVGLKSGRYLFEVKIVETHGKAEQSHGHHGKPYGSRATVRIGLSHAGASPLLNESQTDSMSIDTEGFFYAAGKRKKNLFNNNQSVNRFHTVGFLVNLDANSELKNTVSLFKDGRRVCEPQAIPETLLGKALFPTIAYKNATLQLNFGPTPMRELPFSCRMVADASADDVEVVTPEVTEKPEVIYPIGLPDAGFFDFVDGFLEEHKSAIEISDRAIIDWASKSGLRKPDGGVSNDKPASKFNIQEIDDSSTKRLLQHVAPTSGRNIIIPELKGNLVSTSRKASVKHFAGAGYKQVALVAIGEPPASYKERVQGLVLKDKTKKVHDEFRRKKLAEQRAKAAEQRKANMLKKKQGEAVEEEKADEAEKEEEEAPPTVELDEEEKKLVHRITNRPDISEAVLARTYANFSLPTAEDGFDEIRYVWQPEADAEKALKDWIFAKKLTQRVEDVKIGEKFKESNEKWTATLKQWKTLQSDFKNPAKKKQILAKKAEEKKKEAEAKKKEAEEKGEEAPAEEPEEELDVENLDVMAVEDVTDIGNGQPLFTDFVYEDWTLLCLRYELHLLLHSFKADLDDPDRPGFAEKDLAFHFKRYFNKQFDFKSYGVTSLAELMEIVRDLVTVAEKTEFMQSVHDIDTPLATFVKLTEDHRRERQRRLDAGDESALLKFPRVNTSNYSNNKPGSNNANRSSTQSGGKASGKSAGKSGGSYSHRPAPSHASRSQSGGGSGGYKYESEYRSTGVVGRGPVKRPYSASTGAGSGGGGSYSSSKYSRTSGYGGSGSYSRR